MIAARHSGPSWIVRGATTVVSMPVYDGAVTVAPSSATYTLRDASGVVIQTGAAVVSSGVAVATIDASLVPASLSLSYYWREVWSIVVGGVTIPVERSAWLVRTGLVMVLDLLRLGEYHVLVEEIDRHRPGTGQAALERAWGMMTRELMGMGRRPPQMLDGWQLLDWHARLTLWTLFEGAGPKYRDYVADQWALATAARDSLRLNLDYDEDGQLSPTEEAQPVVGMLIMGGAPGSRRSWAPGMLGTGWAYDRG